VVKLRSAPLDDVHLEALLVLDENGGQRARVLGWLVNGLYRLHARFLNSIIWLVPKAAARFRPRVPFPELGCEPFNITPEEMEHEWDRQTKEVG
jgi:hypothetical protein